MVFEHCTLVYGWRSLFDITQSAFLNKFKSRERIQLVFTVESILTGCITACYDNCSASDRKALQRVVRTAQYITGAKLPATQDL
jgi:hypothetical protein